MRLFNASRVVAVASGATGVVVGCMSSLGFVLAGDGADCCC